mgnify:CR=1 FL=1
MADQKFNPGISLAGAVDLESMQHQVTAEPGQAGGAPSAGGYVIDVTENTFEAMVQTSATFPILMLLWTPSDDRLFPMAKALGDEETYRTFNDRGYWWRNVISDEGYCHMRDSKGQWLENFDPFRSGANQHYVEGNAWQLTFFVPQATTSMAAVLLIGMALFCIHFAGTSCWGLIHVAVASRMTASVGSIQNFASFICASFAPIVTGFIVDTTNSFRLALIICGCVTMAGALAYIFLVRQPISDPRKD